ncbi:MAG: alpha/beta fold hydrolase [Gemmatimonadetes bacterium]|nr:alpha/beta fold hydrolase [Gemmatimonadota bacterium]
MARESDSESLRVPVEGGALHLVAWPAPARAAAPPLVLLHGFMGSVAAWGDLPRRMAADRRVIVVDLPGHGESHRPRKPESYSIPTLAAAVGSAVSQVAPGPVDWLGYSMGGRVLLSGACDGLLSARRVIAESSSPGIEDPGERDERLAVDAERAHLLETLGLEAFVDRWMAMPLFASQRRLAPQTLERERRRRSVHDASALAACLRGASIARQPSYWDRLGPLGPRLLVLTGGLDPRFEAIGDAVVVRCPEARRHIVADAGHAVHLEAPEAWLRAVREHLDRRGAPE